MPYSTYEIHVPQSMSEAALLSHARSAFTHLGVAAAGTVALGWCERVTIGASAQLVRLIVSGRPNQLFSKMFEEKFGMSPGGSLGIDTEFEQYEGPRWIGELTRALLAVTNSDVLVTLNDGGEAEEWSTIEILRRTGGALRFGAWQHKVSFEQLVLERTPPHA
jgi:hypothetical protein